jgi:hypothetical protein
MLLFLIYLIFSTKYYLLIFFTIKSSSNVIIKEQKRYKKSIKIFNLSGRDPGSRILRNRVQRSKRRDKLTGRRQNDKQKINRQRPIPYKKPVTGDIDNEEITLSKSSAFTGLFGIL